MTTTAMAKPRYGFDAPDFIRTMFLIGIPLLLVGALLPVFTVSGLRLTWLGPILFLLGVVPTGFGLTLIAYGLRGKFNMRDQMLAQIQWRGNEQVLDIGTGRGLLLIGAAKRLTTGHVTGIDIWSAEDLSGNGPDAAHANARLEGVTNKISILNADAQQMPFADNVFDVIVSLLCVHNIAEAAGRDAACHEIARVLKPGGTALIADYINTANYARVLAGAGLTVEGPRSYVRVAYGLMAMVTARKKES